MIQATSIHIAAPAGPLVKLTTGRSGHRRLKSQDHDIRNRKRRRCECLAVGVGKLDEQRRAPIVDHCADLTLLQSEIGQIAEKSDHVERLGPPSHRFVP